MNKAGLTVEEVDTFLRRKIDEKRAKTGKGYDLLADDYPAKLYTAKAAKGHMAMRHINDIVYNYFVQWALEFKWHSLVAIQANREGARVNKKQRDGEDRLLTPEDVAEAYGPIQTATNVFTINRGPDEQRKGRTVFGLGKSRSSETGFAIVCQGDWGRSISHSPRHPCTWYRGTKSMTDKLDQFLNTYNGGAVPQEVIGRDSY
jgi:hypothetical protein